VAKFQRQESNFMVTFYGLLLKHSQLNFPNKCFLQFSDEVDVVVLTPKNTNLVVPIGKKFV
jgi:hypothetical protein